MRSGESISVTGMGNWVVPRIADSSLAKAGDFFVVIKVRKPAKRHNDAGQQ